MRSGTSFFNGTVFKKTVARYWPVWAAYLVVWLVCLPLNMLMQLQELDPQFAHYAYTAENILASSAEALLPAAVVFAPLAAMAVFSHLYNSRSANFFGALPVRREGLFLTHYLAGLAFLLVPDLIVGVLTLLVGAAFGANCLTVALYWLLIAFGEGFFFYSFAVFCGMFAGHILALPAFYAIFNALAAALIMMFEFICSQFYYGYYRFGGILPLAAEWLTPTYRIAYNVDIEITIPPSKVSEVALQGGGTLAVYAGAALVLTAAAFLLYRKRRLETAGDVVAVAPMKPVFKYSVSFCAGLFFGWVTALILGETTEVWIAASVVWAVAGCFIAQMILDKSFRVFKKWKGPAVMGLVFCALFAVVCFDLTGYETRVPDASNVASVTVPDLYSSWDKGNYTGFETDDPERIADLIILHRAAVDQRDSGSAPTAPNDTSGSTKLTLVYHLKSGGTLSRSYYFSIDSALTGQEGSPAWALERVYSDPALMEERYGFHEPEDQLIYVDYTNRDWWNSEEEDGDAEPTPEYEYGRIYGQMTFDGVDARALLTAAKADFAAGRLGQFHVGQYPETLRTLNFVYEGDTGLRAGNVEIPVADTATETLAVLERLIPAYLEHEGFTGTEQVLG